MNKPWEKNVAQTMKRFITPEEIAELDRGFKAITTGYVTFNVVMLALALGMFFFVAVAG